MTVQNVLMYFKSVFLTLLKHEIFFFSPVYENLVEIHGTLQMCEAPMAGSGSGWVRVGLTVRAVYGASSDLPVEP